jgi:hypothetical protein
VRVKICKQGASNGVCGGGVGVDEPTIAIERACHRMQYQSSARDRNIRRFARASVIEKHGFQCEKAAKRHHRPDAMVNGCNEAIQAE